MYLNNYSEMRFLTSLDARRVCGTKKIKRSCSGNRLVRGSIAWFLKPWDPGPAAWMLGSCLMGDQEGKAGPGDLRRLTLFVSFPPNSALNTDNTCHFEDEKIDQHMTTLAHFWATKEAWKRTKKKLGSWGHSQWIKRMSYVDEYHRFQETQQKHECTNKLCS